MIITIPTADPRSGVPTEGEPTDSSTQNTPTAAMKDRKAREEGFCLEKVKEQVGCVMDRLDQRWLRDRSRNKNFVKIVANTRNNAEVLIAESEDLIFPYNNKSKTLDHWCMKRGRKAVTEKERGVIGPLNWWMKRGRKAVTEKERGVIGPLNLWMKRGRKAVTEKERGVIGPLNWWMKRGRKAVTEKERGVIGPLNWWMKRGRKAVTEKERGVIGPLSWGPPVNFDHYKDACSFLKHRLNTVADLVREYMG